MDITQKFQNIVRAIVGLPEDPGQPPQIDRLAWYRAQVQACASDGSTVDVAPEDARIPPYSKVQLLTPIPGLAAVVKTGSVVMLGWERGDPARPRAMALYEAGGGFTSLAFGTGPEKVITQTDFANLIAALNAATAPSGGGALSFPTPLPTTYGAQSFKVQR